MKDKKFCGYVDGYGTTTDLDNHGERMSLERIKKVKEDYEKNPERKKILKEHNKNKVIGEIISMKIEEKDDWAGLKIKVGIYKGYEKELKKMKDENWGFSIGAIYSKGKIPKDKENYTPIKLEVSGKLHREIEDYLNSRKIPYEVYIRKSADALTDINFWVGNIAILIGLVNILLEIKKRKEGKIIFNAPNSKIEINKTNIKKVENLIININSSKAP